MDGFDLARLCSFRSLLCFYNITMSYSGVTIDAASLSILWIDRDFDFFRPTWRWLENMNGMLDPLKISTDFILLFDFFRLVFIFFFLSKEPLIVKVRGRIEEFILLTVLLLLEEKNPGVSCSTNWLAWDACFPVIISPRLWVKDLSFSNNSTSIVSYSS